MACLERTCAKCGVSKLSEEYKRLAETCRKEKKDPTWHKWEYISLKDGETEKRIMSCVPKITSFDAFLVEFESSLSIYSSHIFRSNWQHRQMQVCKENLEDGQLIMVMDFSENYKCSFQNEIQTAYFDQNMVTIHPMMCYYQREIDGKPTVIKHAIIGITDDLKHDAAAVKCFETKAISIIEEKIKVTEVIQWTDGCAAQYKSKGCFADVSQQRINTVRNYFETSHGKNVCDGLGAIVKNSCYRAVLSGKVIGDAEAVLKHCTQALEQDLKLTKDANSTQASVRQFVFVPKSDILHDTEQGLKPVKGTRKIHQLKNTGSPFRILTRNLSCFCSGCDEKTGCVNKSYVDEWAIQQLKAHNKNAVVPLSASGGGACASLAPDLPIEPTHSTLPTASVPDTPIEATREAQVGDFVCVSLRSMKRKKAQMYVAQVLDVDSDGEEMQLQYMTAAPNGNFIWPLKRDVSWEDMCSLLCILNDPHIDESASNNRLVYYHFDPEDIKKAKDKL